MLTWTGEIPSKTFLMTLRAVLRNRVYRNGRTGGCHLVSQWLKIHKGFAMVSGCFATDYGHGDHCWNVLPDGRILDATADQFACYTKPTSRLVGGRKGIYIGNPNSRYIPNCPCTKDDQDFLVRNSRRSYTLKLSAYILGIPE